MVATKTLIVLGIVSLCIGCTRQSGQSGTSDILEGNELCRTPGISVVRVKKSPNYGASWGGNDSPYFKADSVEVSYLLQLAFHVRPARFELHAPLPSGNYDVQLPRDADSKQADAIPVEGLRTAFREAFGLSLEIEAKDCDALIVTRSGAGLPKGFTLSEKGASHTEETLASGYEVKAGTINSLCDKLEIALGTPVINETNMDGAFDYHLPSAIKFAPGPEAVLSMIHNLGLQTSRARRRLDVLVVKPTREE